ncbi:MAG: RNA polymerase sigma factor [Cyclobacteriaceae bacterium]
MSEDKELISLIAKRDNSALERLYRSYADKVYNTAISYSGNENDAEEILQDVFLTIWKKAISYRSEASVSTWIYRIATNKSIDFIRKKNSKKRRGFFVSIYRNKSTEPEHDIINFDHPGVQMENKEEARVLFKVIAELSENQQTAFILTQIEGLTQTEVADIMSLSRKSVESLLQRARVNLRKKLEHFYPNRGKRGQ